MPASSARASSDWDEWIAAKIADVGFNERQQTVLAMTIAAMRKEWQAEIGQLRADITVQRSIDQGDVIDLPALPLRRRDVA
jgi:hypothetical protein